MYLKKIVPILALIALSGVFLMGLQAVSATHTTEIKTYTCDINDPPGIEIVKEKSLIKDEPFDITSSLHVDGGNPQWFRWVNYKVFNSHGDQIVNEDRNTGFGGIARCWIDTRHWNAGNYTVEVSYGGNEKDDYPPASNKFVLHVLPC
jgi:hypothetical protein